MQYPCGRHTPSSLPVPEDRLQLRPSGVPQQQARCVEALGSLNLISLTRDSPKWVVTVSAIKRTKSKPEMHGDPASRPVTTLTTTKSQIK